MSVRSNDVSWNRPGTAEPAGSGPAGSQSDLVAALDALPDPFVTLIPVRDRQHRIIDFRFSYANASALARYRVDAGAILGASLLRLSPGHNRPDLFRACRRVVESGEPLRLDGVSYVDNRAATAPEWFDVRAYRSGESLAYTWRESTTRVRREEEFHESQRIANVGSWYWDRESDLLDWSPQMYRIFNIDPIAERLTFLEALQRATHPEDVDLPIRARDRALADGRPFELEQRLLRPGGEIRYVVNRGEVVRNSVGRIVGMRGTCQDVTQPHRDREALLRAQEDLLRREFQLEQEHSVSTTLQHAIMPGGAPNVAGVEVATRYQPASGAEVGGDWYDVFALGGGRVALVVGDVEGHDIVAAALMGQLSSALRVSLLSRDGPATALKDADRFMASLGGGRMATAVVAILDPAAAALTFASAGHPPPFAVTAGDPSIRVVEAEPEPPLGVLADGSRAEHRTVLRPAETLLLYTDGLVERRGEDIWAGVDRLGRLLAPEAGASPETIATRALASIGDHPADDVALVAVRLSRRAEAEAGPEAATGSEAATGPGAATGSEAATGAGPQERSLPDSSPPAR